jgi:hypothetical protein
MSNPVTNVEVEDVLSSIRRLVSEDHRPTQAAQAPAPQDRLVLTPALRVTDVTDDELSEQSGDEAPFTVAEEEAVQEEAPEALILETPYATPDADEAPQFADWPPVEEAASDAEPLSEGRDHDAEEHSSEDLDPNADNTLETSDEQAEASTPSPEPLDHMAQPQEPLNVGDNDGVVEAELMERAVPFAEEVRSQTLSSKIAALEAVIGKRDDQWEPDDTGDSDYSGTEDAKMSWEEPEPEVIDAALDAVDEGLGDVSDVLDEETLRGMVSDIVREELQGALGERITRNVRKLVRREIHRALAAQELE